MTIENSVSNEYDLRTSMVIAFSIAAYPVCNCGTYPCHAICYKRIGDVQSCQICVGPQAVK